MLDTSELKMLTCSCGLNLYIESAIDPKRKLALRKMQSRNEVRASVTTTMTRKEFYMPVHCCLPSRDGDKSLLKTRFRMKWQCEQSHKCNILALQLNTVGVEIGFVLLE